MAYITGKTRLFEVCVCFDVPRPPNQNKSDMMPAMAAWRKFLPVNTSHFVFFRVVGIVNYFIYSGTFDFFSGLEFVPDVGSHTLHFGNGRSG